MISISHSAVKEIKRIQSQRQASLDIPTLKLVVKQGGCSGMFYDLTLENTSFSEMEYRRLEIEGIELLIDSESLDYLKDLKLDYSEDLMGGGFRFHNPGVESICGCGISFSGKK